MSGAQAGYLAQGATRTRWDRTTIGLAALILAVGLTGTVGAVARSTGAFWAGRSGGESALLGPTAPLAGNPVAVRIPTIGVDAEMDRLGLDAGGALEAPPYERAGWYGGVPKPGETGPAVIAAHVDSTTGPVVFYDLKSLETGDAVTVGYDDGATVDFVVTGAESFPKSEFPTDRVYGPTEGADLRLITCIGDFDRRTGSYDQNLVVWATATARSGPAVT